MDKSEIYYNSENDGEKPKDCASNPQKEGQKPVEGVAKAPEAKDGKGAKEDEADATQRRPFTFDRVVRILFTCVVLVAVYFLLSTLKGVLLPFLVACLIAYMLEPVVKWNMRVLHLRRRFLPVVLTLLETIVVIGAAGAIVIPYIVDESTEMAAMLKAYANAKIRIATMKNTGFPTFFIRYPPINSFVCFSSFKEFCKIKNLVTHENRGNKVNYIFYGRKSQCD